MDRLSMVLGIMLCQQRVLLCSFDLVFKACKACPKYLYVYVPLRSSVLRNLCWHNVVQSWMREGCFVSTGVTRILLMNSSRFQRCAIFQTIPSGTLVHFLKVLFTSIIMAYRRGGFFRLHVYKRVVISQAQVYDLLLSYFKGPSIEFFE